MTDNDLRHNLTLAETLHERATELLRQLQLFVESGITLDSVGMQALVDDGVKPLVTIAGFLKDNLTGLHAEAQETIEPAPLPPFDRRNR